MNFYKLLIVVGVLVAGSWAYDMRDANNVQEQIEEQKALSSNKYGPAF